MKTIHIPNGERVRKMLFPDKTIQARGPIPLPWVTKKDTTMTNITIDGDIATFESGEQVACTVEQIKALPRLIHQFRALLHYSETPGDFSLDDFGEMLEEGAVLHAELWPEEQEAEEVK